MCAPRPKLPDTFSVDDLVKKRERERKRGIRSRGVRDVPEQKCARKKKKKRRKKKGKVEGVREKGKERQIDA